MMQNHPDYIKQNLPIPINYKEYINEMNLIFKKVSIIKSFRAAIAFHPKSDRKYMSDFKFIVKSIFIIQLMQLKKVILLLLMEAQQLVLRLLLISPSFY